MSGIKKRKFHIEVWIFLLVICCFVLLSWNRSPRETSFMDEEEVYELDTVWYSDGQEEGISSLPASFACDENGTATVYTTVPDNWAEYGNTLCFRASQEKVRIWLDGNLVLEQGGVDSDTRMFGKSPSSSWVMLRLDPGSEGKELRIELSSPYEEYQGLLNQVYIGTKTALLFFILRTYGVGFATALLLLVISVVMLLFHVLYLVRKVPGNQFFLLGLFGMLTGIWMLGESYMLQFFTDKLMWWYNVTFLSLHLLPLPLLRLVENLPDFTYRKVCQYSRFFQMGYLCVLIVLQTTGIRDFMQMLNLSLVMLLLLCVGIPILIYWDYLHNKNKKISSMVIALTVLCVFACVELAYDLVNIRRQVGSFLQVGVLAFYILVCYFTIRRAINLYVQGMESAYYKKLSYLDQMTGCRNRRAFMERENAWAPGQEDVFLMADLNDLKQVNDLLGHHTGDIYICNCADALMEVFGDKGTCYRMGGDEFLFWGNAIPAGKLTDLEAEFRSRVMEKCREISPLCSISMGHAFATAKDRSLAEVLKRADENMYADKRSMKKETPGDKES